jgi:hypothetical protein
MAMIETHLCAKPFRAMALLDDVRKLGFATPDESVLMVREDRDGR